MAYNKAMVPMGVAGRFMIENERGTGFVKVLAGARYGEILAVHVMGDSSSEFVVAAAALIEMELSTARAADVVFLTQRSVRPSTRPSSRSIRRQRPT